MATADSIINEKICVMINKLNGRLIKKAMCYPLILLIRYYEYINFIFITHLVHRYRYIIFIIHKLVDQSDSSFLQNNPIQYELLKYKQ